MAKIKNRLLIVLALVMLCAVGIFALSACNGNSDYTVTFMVRENGTTGDWQQYTTVDTNDDGSVTLPADPEVDGYVFRDWYTDEACSADNVFDETSVSGDITVYALMAEVEVTLHVRDGEGQVETVNNVSLSGLAAKTVEYESDAQENDLTFVGWYTDASYTQEYSSNVDATALYGRYMAKLTYDNGYEEVYVEYVEPNTLTTAPTVDDVKKVYMDEEDISYADEEGVEMDYTVAITANQTITVLWKTPYLVYEKIDGSASDYMVTGVSRTNYETLESYPVFSFLSENVTVDEKGTKGTVVGVSGTGSSISAVNLCGHMNAAKKVIFNEGIKYINDFNGGTGNTLESVELPESLKIVENSFSFFRSLTSLAIPSGVEVILDSFWADSVGGMSGFDLEESDSGYAFDIVIPKGVKTIANIPYDVQFEDGSAFYAEDGRLYATQNGNKTLVVDYQANVDENGKLTIPEGVVGIQVGIFYFMDVQYLSLPSTFAEAAYTTDSGDYSYYTGSSLTNLEEINANRTGRAYSLTNALDEIVFVSFNMNELPDVVVNNPYLFTASGTPYNELGEEKLVLIGEVASGNITVSVSYINTMLDSKESKYSYEVATGTEIKMNDVITSIGLTEDALGYPVTIDKITELGENFVEGVKTRNQYIEIEYSIAARGYTYELNSDNTYTITGFNESTALQLDNGTYLVVIPNQIDGIAVTSIKDGAFKGNQKISQIYIASSVKVIGKEAFMNTPNLEYISVLPGGLETIGKSAFENVGCILQQGEYVINPDISTEVHLNGSRYAKSVIIMIPLANIKTIEPYAFKSIAICAFVPVEGEEARTIINADASSDGEYISEKKLIKGEFYYVTNADSVICGIVKFISVSQVESTSAIDGAALTKDIFDVQYYAMAAGAYSVSSDNSFAVGHSGAYMLIKYGTMMGSMIKFMENDVIRYEMMEGSAYFIDNIHLGIVSKIHANAFTDIDTDTVTIEMYSYSNNHYDDTWLDIEKVKQQDSSIFEDGWLNGLANSSNTMMEKITTSQDSLS